MQRLCSLESGETDDLVEALAEALPRCQATARAAQLDSAPEASGVELTLACLIGTRAYVVRAGETRCYLWGPPALRKLARPGEEPAADICQRLVARAREAGGRGEVTVALAPTLSARAHRRATRARS